MDADLYLDYTAIRRRRILHQFEVNDALAGVMVDGLSEEDVFMPYLESHENDIPQGQRPFLRQQLGRLQAGSQGFRRRHLRRRSTSMTSGPGSQGFHRMLLGSSPLALEFSASSDAYVNAGSSTFCIPSTSEVASAAIVLSINGTLTSLITPGLVLATLSLDKVGAFPE